MQCEEARDQVGALIDGELAGDVRREIDAHIEGCGGCAQELSDLRQLKRQVTAVRAAASPAFAARLRSALDAEAARMIATPQQKPPVRLFAASSGKLSDLVGGGLRPLMRLAAVVLMSALLSAAATWFMLSGTADRARIESDVLSAHVRSLLQEQPVQIASSDRHTVKPWFSGRIEFAPAVVDLAANGFPLLGGRLDYVGGRRVAALVYRRRLHLVTVFMWPSAGPEETKPSIMKVNGYNLVTWSKGGMTYWAASDLSENELLEFQALL